VDGLRSSRQSTFKRIGTDDPAGETRCSRRGAREYGYPHAIVGAAYFARDTSGEVLAKPPRATRARRCAISRCGRNDRAGGARRAGRWTIRNGDGYALLEKHGFSFDLQTPWWHLDAAARSGARLSKTQIVIVPPACRATGSAEGLAGWRGGARNRRPQQNVAIRFPASAVRACRATLTR